MPTSLVRTVPFPSQSRLSPLYKSSYFVDAYAVGLPRSAGHYNADALARTFLGHPPAWFSVLMWIRDRAVSVVGVKPSSAIGAAAERKGLETISVFPIISRSENEVIVGEKDSHLDFQTSVLIREIQASGAAGHVDGHGKGKEVVVTTAVQCHGLLGKAYITVIRPFHVLIVKYNLARIQDKIAAAEASDVKKNP